MHRLAASTALLLLLGMPAHADCAPDGAGAGGVVTCTGTDADGYRNDAAGLTVTVVDGAVVENAGGDAIRVDGAGASVENAGRIEATADGDEAVQGVDGLTVDNAETGVIRAVDKGIQANDGLTVNNAGLIASDGEGIGGGDDAFMLNGPTATITANEDAVQVGEDALIANLGTIESTGDDGDGIDVDSGVIDNQGTITTAAAGGAGIGVDAAVGDLTIQNDGAIRGGTGILVETGTPDDAANVRSQIVINSGIIEGRQGVALNLGAGDDVLTVVEGGTILGDVILGEGDDTLILVDLFGGEGPLAGLFAGGSEFDTAVFAGLNSTDVDFVSFVDLVLTLTVNGPATAPIDPFDLRLTEFESFQFVDVTASLDDLVAPIPLPAGGVLLMGALGLLGFARRRG